MEHRLTRKKNRTLGGSGYSLPARGPTITFQRGTTGSSTAEKTAAHRQHKTVCAWRRPKQYENAHASHAASRAQSEMPALCLGDKEIAEHLDAGHRFQFLRIDEIGVQSDGIGLSEQLDKAAILLDEIVGQ
jgi:hypothetical protein